MDGKMPTLELIAQTSLVKRTCPWRRLPIRAGQLRYRNIYAYKKHSLHGTMEAIGNRRILNSEVNIPIRSLVWRNIWVVCEVVKVGRI